MLSPCIRQVTHALLTRPPLSYKSLGFIVTPFDLHVLSTPPAFILSQDQTLTIIVCPASLFSGITVCSSELILSLSSHLRSISNEMNFSMESFQGCITVCLSRYKRCFASLKFCFFGSFASLPSLKRQLIKDSIP